MSVYQLSEIEARNIMATGDLGAVLLAVGPALDGGTLYDKTDKAALCLGALMMSPHLVVLLVARIRQLELELEAAR